MSVERKQGSTMLVAEHGTITKVFITRRFASGSRLGVGYHESPPDHSAWFVYSDAAGSMSMHCGPYSTREQAEDWIGAIQADQRSSKF